MDEKGLKGNKIQDRHEFWDKTKRLVASCLSSETLCSLREVLEIKTLLQEVKPQAIDARSLAAHYILLLGNIYRVTTNMPGAKEDPSHVTMMTKGQEGQGSKVK